MSESVGHIGWSPDFREYEDIAAKKTILGRVVTKAEWTLLEATCQSLREQSSRWEAQALEAGGRIAELEIRIKNLWERECHDDKTVFVCQDGSGAICVSYWGKLKMLEARVRRYQEKADAVYRYTSAKPPKTDAMMAILTELSLEGEARAALAEPQGYPEMPEFDLDKARQECRDAASKETP